jgi:ribonucleoside-diphosphate reductase alpha chain
MLAYFDSDTGELLECFLSKGSTGGCSNSLTGLSRMISLAARGGIDVYSIADQLKSCGSCPSYAVRSATKHDTSKGSSCPVAVGNALIDMYEEMQEEFVSSEEYKSLNDKKAFKIVDKPKEEIVKKEITCPECGGDAVFQGGCVICPDCGWSRCE